jgi:hypothetical protein
MADAARPTLAYRSDIDGLRAVAVLAVLFYHFQLLKMWGGFVGVDVFFVISGYLISSVILKEISQGRFSLNAFYQRRIRRIFPALIFMMAACLVAAYIFLLPSELESFAKSLLSASLSTSISGCTPVTSMRPLPNNPCSIPGPWPWKNSFISSSPCSWYLYGAFIPADSSRRWWPWPASPFSSAPSAYTSFSP